MQRFIFIGLLFVVITGCNKPLSEKELLENYAMPKEDTVVTTKAISNNYDTKFVWMDKPRLRKEAGAEGNPIALLVQGEEVYLMGEQSDFNSRITLRCVYFDAPWVKIMRKDGTIGWIYGGALSKTLVEKPTKLHAIIAYFPDEAPKSKHINDMKKLAIACEKLNIYFIIANPENKNCIAIGDIAHPISSINPSKWVGEAKGFGYLFVRQGKTPEFIPFNTSAVTIKRASEYFDVEIE